MIGIYVFIQNITCLTFRTLIEFKLKIGAQIIIYIKIKIHKQKKNFMFILVMIPISHTRLYLNIFQTKNVQTRTCHKQKAAIIYQQIT